jgi:hypothetical protein
MSDLATYAALAEIFGVLTIVMGAIFAVFQLSEFRKRRRNQVAADLCRGFSQPELAKAVTLIKRLPDGVSLREIQDMDVEYEEAAQIVGMTFETMGLLVYRNIASFRLIQELTGGLLLMMWRKIEVWIKTTREEQGNPRFGEWVQWLAEQVAACESDVVPAYEAHSNWIQGRR